jgi:hypothetical protein
MSENVCFFFKVRISHVLNFISICDKFTDSPSYQNVFRSFLPGLNNIWNQLWRFLPIIYQTKYRIPWYVMCIARQRIDKHLATEYTHATIWKAMFSPCRDHCLAMPPETLCCILEYQGKRPSPLTAEILSCWYKCNCRSHWATFAGIWSCIFAVVRAVCAPCSLTHNDKLG